MMHTISIGAWGFHDSSAADRFHCSLAITKVHRFCSALRRLAGLCGTWREYVAAVQHAQSRQQEKGVRTLLCLFSLCSIFNYASFDNCGGIPRAPVVISLPRMTGICLINQQSLNWRCSAHSACYQQATAQPRANLLMSWDARPFPDSDANLVSSAVEGMAFRWMGDANCFNRRFHLIWRWLLPVITRSLSD